jgi:hypothetical protein
MRRAISVILLCIGAWLLMSGLTVAWVNFGEGLVAEFGVAGIMAAFAAPFLALGTAVSPGNRRADLGMTLMVAAGIAAALALMMWMVVSDPGFKQFMPPGKQMPDLRLAPASGLATEFVVAASGYLLWYFGRQQERREKPDLKRIFGDS